MTFSHPVDAGIWLGLGEHRLSLALASSGFAWIGVDQQHGRFDDATTLRLLDALPEGAPPAYVRVRALDAGLIGRALDAGAAGVIVPMVSTVEQAAAVVVAGRYAPLGARSYGPIRGYASTADALAVHPLLAVMIETADAVDRAADIARVPGIDMLFVGAFDLAIALGRDLDELLADDSPGSPLERIVDAARAADIRCGAFAGTPERATLLAAHGITVIATATDAGVIAAGAVAMLARR